MTLCRSMGLCQMQKHNREPFRTRGMSTERGGFEPPNRLPDYAISSRVPSAARTSLQDWLTNPPHRYLVSVRLDWVESLCPAEPTFLTPANRCHNLFDRPCNAWFWAGFRRILKFLPCDMRKAARIARAEGSVHSATEAPGKIACGCVRRAARTRSQFSVIGATSSATPAPARTSLR